MKITYFLFKVVQKIQIILAQKHIHLFLPILLLEGQVHGDVLPNNAPHRPATSALEDHSLEVLVCLLLIDAKSHLAMGELGSVDSLIKQKKFLSFCHNIKYHLPSKLVSYKVDLKNKRLPQQGSQMWQTDDGLQFLPISECTGWGGPQFSLTVVLKTTRT